MKHDIFVVPQIRVPTSTVFMRFCCSCGWSKDIGHEMYLSEIEDLKEDHIREYNEKQKTNADKIIEFAKRLDVELLPWQIECLKVALDPDGPKYHFIMLPKKDGQRRVNDLIDMVLRNDPNYVDFFKVV